MVGQTQSGPSNHLLVAGDIVKSSLTQCINETLKVAGLDCKDVISVSAGLAGVDFDGTGADEMKELIRAIGFGNSVINGDMVIAHAGALRLRSGVVALAGTGSVVLGIGRNGERVKVGGWGPVYGDEGSAYRIGEMSLRAAARAYDGVGPETALTAALLKALGLNEFRETLVPVYVKGMEAREIAALSRTAYEVAEAGDLVAREIFFKAGDELAVSVAAATRKLNVEPDQILVSYQGAVIDSCRLLRDRFIENLKRIFPRAAVWPPEFEPVIGAYLLGCKAVGWEVDSRASDELKKTNRKPLCISTPT